MKAKTFILSTCTALVLGIATAQAGQCSAEIDNLAKVLASKDAGSGPTGPGTTTGSAVATTPSGGHAPTATMSAASEGKTGPTEAKKGSDARAALDRARELDRQGKESECMSAVAEAKRLAGS